MDDLARLIEAIEAFSQRAKRYAVRITFFFTPTRADADLEAPIGDDVEACHHVGQQRRMPIDDAAYHTTYADTLGGLGEC